MMYNKYNSFNSDLNRYNSFNNEFNNFEDDFFNDEYDDDEYEYCDEEVNEDSNMVFNNGVSYGQNYYDFEIANYLERFVAGTIDFIIFLMIHLTLIFAYREAVIPYITSTKAIMYGVLFIFAFSTSANGILIPLFLSRKQTIGEILVRIKATTPEGYDMDIYKYIIKFLISYILLPINIGFIFFSEDRCTLSQMINDSIVKRI